MSTYRAKPKHSGKRWTYHEMCVLFNLKSQGLNQKLIATKMQRSEHAIKRQLESIAKSMENEGVDIASYDFISCPLNYVCIVCKKRGDHWIMCCPKREILIP